VISLIYYFLLVNRDSTGKGGSSETGTYFAYDFTNKREVSYSNTTLDNGDVSMTFDFKFYNKVRNIPETL